MESVQTKTCTKCKAEKPVAEFGKRSSTKDGLSCYCKPCTKAMDAARYAREVDRRRVSSAKYRAEHAEELRPKKAAYYKANADQVRATQSAWRAANKERKSAMDKAYYQANAERIKADQAAWRKANRAAIRERDRAAHAKNPGPARERVRKWKESHPDRASAGVAKWRQDNPDRVREVTRLAAARRRARQSSLPTYDVSKKDLRRLLSSPCSVTGCPNTDIEIDHVIPVSRGGSHGVGNFQPLCRSHNARKHKRLWIEFRVYLSRTKDQAA